MKSIALFAIVTLTTAAQAGDITAFPSWVSFGQVEVGYSSSRSITLRNNGRDDIRSLSIYEWGDTSEFRVSDFGCWSLPPFGSCTVNVDYRPTEAGSHRIDIDVWYSGGSERINVDGRAYDRDNPLLRDHE